ncbi:DUF6446 family protein [uncultured Tateyamaria sp.]|uniref:DUF6446 family protein n=1 Tax=uncultured Tateyamaria sp. TaxID=455651 RepID=UPI00262C4028|nr:DUF6446 family protein [uncultured Tateyamaria sp.]
MSGKIIGIILLLTGIIAGAGLYYLQVYGFYEDVDFDVPNEIEMVSIVSGVPEPLLVHVLQAIDADSSPIRFRACFETEASLAMLTETFVGLEPVTPRNAPPWFECFNAEALGAEIEAGTALTFLGQKNVHFGVDRIVAITEDGRGYIWHELNDCGEKAYDGTIVGEECPRRDTE